MEQQAGLKSYIVLFTTLYAGIMIFFMILSLGFGVELGNAVNIATLAGASFGAVSSFLKKEQRAPSKKESRKLALWSYVSLLITSILVTFAATAIVDGSEGVQALMAALNQISLPIWLVIIAVLSLIYYLVLILIYGWAARKIFAKQSQT